MKKWVEVCKVEDFVQEVQLFVYEGEPIAIFKRGDQFYAISDICSHADASLSEGELEEFEVICPRHGARFDIRTGEHKSFPAVAPVKSYPVKVEEGVLFVEIEE